MQRVIAPCEEVWSNAQLVPAKRAASLIFGYSCLEEVLFFLQVHDFAHPRERVCCTGDLLG